MVRRREDMEPISSRFEETPEETERKKLKSLYNKSQMLRAAKGFLDLEKRTGVRMLTPEMRETILIWNEEHMTQVVYVSTPRQGEGELDQRITAADKLLDDFRNTVAPIQRHGD